MQALLADGISTWVEVVYTGEDIVPDLREKLLDALVEDSQGLITLLRVKNQRIAIQTLAAQDTEQTLDDLSPQDVFSRCLDAHAVPREQRPELVRLYQEILTQVQESDANAD